MYDRECDIIAGRLLATRSWWPVVVIIIVTVAGITVARVTVCHGNCYHGIHTRTPRL